MDYAWVYTIIISVQNNGYMLPQMGHLNNHGTLVHASQMYSYMHILLMFGASILVYRYLQSLVLVQLMFWNCYGYI